MTATDDFGKSSRPPDVQEYRQWVNDARIMVRAFTADTMAHRLAMVARAPRVYSKAEREALLLEAASRFRRVAVGCHCGASNNWSCTCDVEVSE